MHSTFTSDLLYVDDIVVYLKNERTGSSTIRKCKFIGQIIDFTNTKVKIMRLSPPDKFVTPEECKDYGVDTVYPDDVVNIIIRKHDSSYINGVKEFAKYLKDHSFCCDSNDWYSFQAIDTDDLDDFVENFLENRL